VLGASGGATAVAVVTEEFAQLAEVIAKADRQPELRILVLPHPLEGRPEAEIREIARDQVSVLVSLLRDA